MPYIGCLNKNGKFSIKTMKENLSGYRQTYWRRNWPWFVIAGIFAAFTLAAVFMPARSDAAEFQNYISGQSYPANIQNSHLGSPDQGAWGDFDFTTTTQPLYLHDATFPMHNYDPANTTATQLTVETPHGTWHSYSTTTLPTTDGYDQVIYYFATSTYPWILPNETMHFIFAPRTGAFGSTSQLFLGLVTSTPDSFDAVWQRYDVTADYNFLLHSPIYVPAMRLNYSPVTSFGSFPEPTPADFGLTGTSSAMTQDFGFFGNMLKQVILFMFAPAPSSLLAFQSLRMDIMDNKFPFAWFQQAKYQLSTLGAAPSSTIVTIPTRFGNFKIFDSEAARTNGLTVAFEAMYLPWAIAIIWLQYLFYIWDRLCQFMDKL